MQGRLRRTKSDTVQKQRESAQRRAKSPSLERSRGTLATFYRHIGAKCESMSSHLELSRARNLSVAKCELFWARFSSRFFLERASSRIFGATSGRRSTCAGSRGRPRTLFLSPGKKGVPRSRNKTERRHYFSTAWVTTSARRCFASHVK